MRQQEDKLHPSLLLLQQMFLLPFHLVLISTLLSLPPSYAAATYEQYLDCAPAPFTCGDLTIEVSYPFLVKSRPEYCGHPDFNLTCADDNGTMVIQINNTEYQVKGVDYSQSLLTIVDQKYVGQSCPKPEENTTLDDALFEYSNRDRNLTVFINCSSLALPDLTDIECLSGDMHWYYYWLGSGNLPAWWGSCQASVIVPVDPTALDLLMRGNLSFGQALQEGFNVTWTAGSGWCCGCVESGGFCGYDKDDDQPCFCPNGRAVGSCQEYNSASKRKIVIGVAAAVSGFLLVCILFYLYRRLHKRLPVSIFFWKKKSENARNIEAFLQRYESFAPKRYRYCDVKKITKSFRDKLGQGGYGTVYKGSLDGGCLVAVKILNASKGNGDEFVNEVSSIGRTSHVNIVSLIGFCSEGSKRALIYEFMPNGSLDKYLYSENPEVTLGFEKLYQIAIGIARGLEYLHRGCSIRIVHFDIKPHNILLDQDFCPKIADFGLAKLCPPKDSVLSMASARGTIGYIAPEVFFRNFGVVSSKSDVYSYGMMVLEMVGGRRNIDVGVRNTNEIYFPHWIYEHLDQDGDLQVYGVTSETEEIARKMILVGLWCIQIHPENRFSMSKVVDMLQGSVNDLSVPPRPYLSAPVESPIASASEQIS